MTLTRRQLVALLTASAFAPALYVGNSWWNVPAEKPYDCLSNEEGRIVVKIAEAAFALQPDESSLRPDPNQADLDRFFDHLLRSMMPQNKKLLKLLLHALDNAAYLDESQSFTDLPPNRAQDQLISWLDSEHHLVRSAVTSLVALLGMGYCAHPRSSKILSKYHSCGFGGAIGGFK